MSLETDPRWLAVQERDASLDGKFYYSVRTTGVYCRPSCGARRPRLENVAFHETPAAAERQGYRPCKRCRPREPSRAKTRVAHVERLCRFIEDQLETPSLRALAEVAGFSPFHTQKLFKAVTGVTPAQYSRARRAARLRGELERQATVTGAAYAAGYAASSRFYEGGAKRLGMSPRSYRGGGSGVEIVFTVAPCSFGRALVGETSRGICAVLLGDDERELEAELERSFPHATLLAASKARAAALRRVVASIEEGAAVSLPLDVRGTLFQERVWKALSEIPPGQTRSYAELARAIGAPQAARAVASACGRNNLAVLVPCHRAVAADGSLAGFRWGIRRKQRLLARERESER